MPSDPPARQPDFRLSMRWHLCPRPVLRMLRASRPKPVTEFSRRSSGLRSPNCPTRFRPERLHYAGNMSDDASAAITVWPATFGWIPSAVMFGFHAHVFVLAS